MVSEKNFGVIDVIQEVGELKIDWFKQYFKMVVNQILVDKVLKQFSVVEEGLRIDNIFCDIMVLNSLILVEEIEGLFGKKMVFLEMDL